MEVRSLGYRTDLAILAREGSQITDRGDHLIIRTPGNPDYWRGNFLLLRDLLPGSGSGWRDRFAAQFPDAQHLALGVDETDERAADPGELADWRQSLELAAAVHAGGPGGETGFLTARLAAKRALTEAGHGAWLGAFLDGTLVSQLGLVTGISGLARYQDVETHPAARRRGLAGTLVWQAGAAALADGASTLVMVADPEDAAIRVYRSVGFTVTETQLSFVRQPDSG